MIIINFKEDLKNFSLQIQERKNHVQNEESTKQALIIPFIQLLGYDVFNPLEVQPEYTADFGKKKGERVDYAIFNNSKVTIFFEAKNISENLEKHNAQLSRYFNSTPEVKLAILSNGVEYHLFTDLNTQNIMDEIPFLRFNILNMNEDSIIVLNQIRKKNFNAKTILEFAEELVYSNDLDSAIINMLQNPTDEFIRFIIKDVVNTRLTANVLDKFRPLVKKSILSSINALYLEQSIENPSQKENKTNTNNIRKIKNTKITPVSLTADEILVFDKDVKIIDEPIINTPTPLYANEYEMEIINIIKNILTISNFDISKIDYLVTEKGVVVENEKHWIATFKFEETNKFITIPIILENVAKVVGNIFTYEKSENNEIFVGTKIYLYETKDLYKLAKLIIKTYELCCSTSSQSSL